MSDVDRFRTNAATTAILVDVGIDLMRQNIKRSHVTMDEKQRAARLSSWLRRTDDAIPGDTAGAVRIRKRAP